MLVLFRVLIPIVYFTFWIWAVVDVIRADKSKVEHLPKSVWLLIVLLVPILGGGLWLILGRPTPLGPFWGTLQRPSVPGRRREAPEPGVTDEWRPAEGSREEAIRRYYEEKRRRDEQQWLEEQFRRPDAEPPDAPPGG